jgi:methylmalonyl-CoA mutase N-terminal domain/subunit
MAIEPREKPEFTEREADFSTMSGHPVEPLYGPENAPADPEATIGEPGEFTFTRVNYS